MTDQLEAQAAATDLQRELADALERERATRQVLELIARPGSDLGEILQMVVTMAVRICRADAGSLWRRDGDLYRMVAHEGGKPGAREWQRTHPLTPDRGTPAGRAIVERSTQHFPDLLADPDFTGHESQRRTGAQTSLAVPLLRDGEPIGVLQMGRQTVRPYSAEEIRSVETFATQAAIAIENVRLFNETKEALEQQTATAEILEAISRSTTDLSPVFQTITEKALRLCHGDNASILHREGDAYRMVAHAGFSPEEAAAVERAGPLPVHPGPGSVTGRVLLHRQPVQIADVQADADYDLAVQYATPAEIADVPSSLLGVPILRGDYPIGVIVIRRHRVGPFTDKQVELVETFAAQAEIAIENVRLFNETKEALERQTAIADVLQIIGRSAFDLRLVLDTLLDRAVSLCEADDGSLLMFEGAATRTIAASANYESRDHVLSRGAVPAPPGTISARVREEGRSIHVEDLDADPAYARGGLSRPSESRARTALGVPLLRDGKPIGLILLRRNDSPRAFTPGQMQLVETFADQAAIAIENVRLFNETKEALEQRSAVADVLGVISRSPTDIQPVLDAVAATAARLLRANDVVIVRREGDEVVGVAHVGDVPLRPDHGQRQRLDRGMVSHRAILEGKPVHVPDLLAVADDFPTAVELARVSGQRTSLAVPLLREGSAIGSILLRRTEARPFSDEEIHLLQTFADQAAIAIENVRLFNGTKEALEREKALADVLQTIANSPNDLQPVLDTIARSAATFCKAENVMVALAINDDLQMRAHFGFADLSEAEKRANFWGPARTTGKHPRWTSVSGRAYLEGHVVHVPDVLALDENEFATAVADARRYGDRALLAAPLLRQSESIGVILLRRTEPGPFTDEQVDLVRAFADQAVIAIENVRLFNETKEALERQTATSQVLELINAARGDLMPVYQQVLDSAQRLLDGESASLQRLVDGELETVAVGAGVVVGSVGQRLPVSTRTAVGRAILQRATVHVPDVSKDPDLPQNAPWTRLAVPIVREGVPLGVIVIGHAEVRPFTAQQIELLETFAGQLAIAMANVRLFNETKEALERQTATSDVLRAISTATSDLQPVLETVLERAVSLCEADHGWIIQVHSGAHRLAAYRGDSTYVREFLAQRAATYSPRGWTLRAVREGTTQVVDDVSSADVPTSDSPRLGFATATKSRSLIAVPIRKKNEVLGVIVLTRSRVARFSVRQIALVEMFAEQAAVAIENVRLFNETKEALEQQRAVSDVLAAIGRATDDAGPVFRTILEHAGRLCDADRATLSLREDDRVVFKAGWNIPQAAMEEYAREALPVDRSSGSGRAIAEGRTCTWDDMTLDEEISARMQQTRSLTGARSVMAVPLMLDGVAIGAINLRRTEVRPFTGEQAALVETFAEQATLAIENVRLFNATKEALEQQQAVSEILEVISRSPSDLQPVFDAVVDRALRLTEADNAFVLRRDATGFVPAAHAGRPIGRAEQAFMDFHVPPPRGAGRETLTGRVLLERATVRIDDPVSDPEYFVNVAGVTQEELPEGFPRSVIGVPLLQSDEVVGVILVRRLEVRPFSDREQRLLEAFASQAVIAIENVRLFNETKEALEQQTATADVLTAIAGSTSDLTPVFDVVVEQAARLCEARDAFVFRRDPDGFRLVASRGALYTEGERREERTREAVSAGSGETFMGAVALEGSTMHYADVLAPPPHERFDTRLLANWNKEWGVRALLGVPMILKGQVVGVIGVTRPEPRPFSDGEIRLVETFAEQSAIAIENARLFNETKEALDQQTATAEVLQIISRSAFDLDAVFKTLLLKAIAICHADWGSIQQAEGPGVRNVAQVGGTDAFREVNQRTLYLPGRETTNGRALLEKRPIHVPDLAADPEYTFKEAIELGGIRTNLVVPMVRDDKVIGTFGLSRNEVRPFTDKEIALVSTFADQAAIAIENVRLFNETKESLERQTAIAGILRAISESPTDVQPVLDAIAESAARFCGAEDAAVILVDGDTLRTRAHRGPIELRTPLAMEFPLTRGTVTGRSIIERQTVHVPDLLAESDEEYPVGKEQARRMGHRTTLAAPLLREGVGIGAILLRRMEVRPFSEHQVELVRTFADQAVIAIENVRLFNETTEGLERQTAISEVLASIGRSAFDLPTLLNTVIERAARLCRAPHGIIYRLEDGALRIAAGYQLSDELRDLNEKYAIKAGDLGSLSGRVTAEARPVRIDDARADPDYRLHEHQRVGDLRAMMGVPLLREGQVIGVMSLWRNEPSPFTDAELGIVTTFADQAAIAIENVRLFNETKEALERQTAVSEILKVISASPDSLQPVFDAIAAATTRFCGAEDAAVLLISEGVAKPVAHHGPVPLVAGVALDNTSVTGMAILEKRTVQIEDATVSDRFPLSRQFGAIQGQRAVLATPLMRSGQAIGAVILRRLEPRLFTERQVELVETFADQAVIAIENVRLFNETKESLEQQTAVAEILKTISRSAFDLRPVLETLVEQAARLCEAEHGSVHRWDGNAYRTAAFWGPELTDAYKQQAYTTPRYPGRDTLIGRTALTRDVVHIPDVLADAEYAPRDLQSLSGYRTVLGVPLIREGFPIGVFGLMRNEVKPFTERQIELVRTFADQAAIAIENVRLFNETKESLEQQRAVADVLKVIGRAPTDLQRVLDIVVENSVRLASADVGWVSTSYDEPEVNVTSVYGNKSDGAPLTVLPPHKRKRSKVTDPPETWSVVGRAAFTKKTIHIPDLDKAPEVREPGAMLSLSGARAVLGVPLLHEDSVVGAFVVGRHQPRAFTAREIELVETFADQAGLAVANMQLFNEIQDKSRQLEVASRHKSEFLANMSHELRTPLNAIIGFTDVMLQEMFGPLNAKQKEYLDDVRGSGNHLLTLINDILDLSKIEAGRVELELGEFSFPDALEHALTLVRERATRHGIRLATEVAKGVGAISADERKVKQILVNLLSNAVKFTPDGGWVSVSAKRENGQLQVAVRDTGIGVAPQDQERIFEEFQQVGRDPERSREGTGLGLTLAKRFVELHGGRIWVESEIGKGSTFTFAIPVRQTALAEAKG